MTPPEEQKAPSRKEGLGQKIASAMIWDYGGYTLLMLLGMALSIVLVRFLGKEKYAIYAFVINLKAMLILLVSFGMDTSISRFVPEWISSEKKGNVRSLLGIILKSRAAILIVLAIPCLLLAGPITRIFLDKDIFTWYVRLMPLFMAPVLFYGPLQTFLVTQYRQRYINIFCFLSASINLIISAWLVAAGYGPGAVILALFASELLLVAAFTRETRSFFPPAVEKKEKALPLKRLFTFSFNIYLYSVMLFVMGKGLDIFLLGKLHADLAQITYYSIAFSFAYFSISALDRAFSGGFIVPLITELYTRREGYKLQKVFSGAFQFIYIYALPVTIGGLILAGDLISILFGREYGIPVGRLAAVTLLYMVITKFGRISASFMTAMDREKQLIFSRFIFGLANVVLNLLLIPRYGAMGAVIGTGIAGILAICYEARILDKILQPSYPAGFLLKVFGASLVMGITVMLVRSRLGPGSIQATMGALAAGVIAYIILLILIKPLTEEVTEFLGNLKLPGKRLILLLLR